ncbi:MAG: PIN domain-containing protein [Nitrospinota bacterium]|nr:PIN domain-containing protein [Nitrospinota bacterium]
MLAITFITVGELYYGAEKRGWGIDKRQHLETTLRNFVVIPYDHEIARVYGYIFAKREGQGEKMPWPDAWIAACAVRHKVPLITHDAHFKDVDGLEVVTEYKVE